MEELRERVREGEGEIERAYREGEKSAKREEKVLQLQLQDKEVKINYR